MQTANPDPTEQKKDLHIGGLGRTSASTLASVADPSRDTVDSWLDRARDTVGAADDFLRANPWTALAMAAALGLAAGYLLAKENRT